MYSSFCSSLPSLYSMRFQRSQNTSCWIKGRWAKLLSIGLHELQESFRVKIKRIQGAAVAQGGTHLIRDTSIETVFAERRKKILVIDDTVANRNGLHIIVVAAVVHEFRQVAKTRQADIVRDRRMHGKSSELFRRGDEVIALKCGRPGVEGGATGRLVDGTEKLQE